MKGSDFEAMIASGQRPFVTFLKGVEEQEGYLEAGMRGQVVAVREEDSDLLVFTVDQTEFESFNQTFETSNYYDRSGNPCLTAKQAGMYKPQEALWCRKSEDAPMQAETFGRLQLYERFKEAEATSPYVQWLEDRVLALENDFVPQAG